MFTMSKRARLGLYVMLEFAKSPNARRSAEDLAQSLDASVNHLAKVLQALARAGWALGTRGAHGGYSLVVSPKRISMADVVELFEGSPRFEQCRLKAADEHCVETGCEIKHVVREIEEHAYYTLKSVTIDMLANPPGVRREHRPSLRVI